MESLIQLCLALSALIISAVALQPCSHGGSSGVCFSVTAPCPTGTVSSLAGCQYQEQCCYLPSTQSLSGASPAGCGVTSYNYGNKIVNGTATVIDKYPWTVSIQTDHIHSCGGSIINERWILTAAHCFQGPFPQSEVSRLSVLAGSTFQDRIPSLVDNLFSVEQIVIHALFEVNKSYDVALLKLSRPIDLSRGQKKSVCLANRGDSFTGQWCVVTGWGSTAGRDANNYQPGPQSQLREVSLPIVSHSVCETDMGDVHPSMICAGVIEGGIDACQGDSGGPLACQGTDGVWKQVGVVSYGENCAMPKRYGVYTDVSKMENWIRDQINVFS